MNLTKPRTEAAPAVGTITVNVGVPGNIKKIVLAADQATVRTALAAATLNPKGYEIRVAGTQVGLDEPLSDGQTVLLLRPVVGNVNLSKPSDEAGITVNVGVPGNIKKVVLVGATSYNVQHALAAAGLNADGYEIRVSGERVNLDHRLSDGQTVLLLRPVVGNN